MNDWDLVNGLRFKIRKEILIIDIWIPEVDNADRINETRDWILSSICLNPDTSIELFKFNVA